MRVRVIRTHPHAQLYALSVEQRQEIDLPAVIERLRTAKRGFGRSCSALQQLCSVPLIVERDERVFDILERPHDRVFVTIHGFLLATLGDPR